MMPADCSVIRTPIICANTRVPCDPFRLHASIGVCSKVMTPPASKLAGWSDFLYWYHK